MPRVAAKRTTARRAPATRVRYVAMPTYAGRGGYAPAKPKRKRAAPTKSKSIGQSIGEKIGGFLGGAAQTALKVLTGFGDYQVKSNALIPEANSPPQVVNRSNKEFVVRHREYIKDIFSLAGTANTPSAFGLESFSINPGDPNTFPWLSTIADKFEQYRIEGMLFEYKSLYSDAVVTQNGSIGSVVLATEYNAGNPSFQTKQAMENYQFAQSSKPSCSIIHPVECARSQNVLSELYIRGGSVPDGQDVKTYDFGDFQIASQGIPLGSAGAAVDLGELWVTYQIALIKPRIPTEGSSGAYTDSGYAHFYTPDAVSITPSMCVPAGITKSVNTNLEVDTPTNNVIRFKLGSVPMNYLIDIQWRTFTTSVGWKAPSTFTASGGTSTFYTSNPDYPANILMPQTSSSTNGASFQGILQVPAATPSVQYATVTISNDGLFPTAAQTQVMINAVPQILS